MGSGRGDRNQSNPYSAMSVLVGLQWGPVVVVTGIRITGKWNPGYASGLQWGPVVVTGIRRLINARSALRKMASMGSGRGDRNQSSFVSRFVSSAELQWGPVVVTGIRGDWLNAMPERS